MPSVVNISTTQTVKTTTNQLPFQFPPGSPFGEMFKEKPKFQHRFKIQDTEFGFIPDLENISFGEFIDLSKNITDVDNWNKAMAVMYRPIIDSKGDKYSIEDYKGSNTYSEVMKFAPLGVTLGANVFFWTLRNDLLNSSLSYLRKIILIIMF